MGLPRPKERGFLSNGVNEALMEIRMRKTILYLIIVGAMLFALCSSTAFTVRALTSPTQTKAIFSFASIAQNPQTLSLSCQNADIIDVLRGIAIQNNVNIVPDRSVTGTVTIYLDNAPFEEGLQTLLETNGFTYEKQNSIYLVRKQATATQNINISVANGQLTIDARNADVSEIIQKLSTEANINIVAESGLSGNITAHFSNIPIDDALYAIFSANNYTLYENGGIYRVGNRALSKGSFAIFSNKGLLTIDVKDVPLEDVLQEIATQSKINLVIVGGIGKGTMSDMGNVTMRLENVSLERALEMLTAASGTAYKKIDDIYLVGKTTTPQGVENPLIEQKVIWLKHINGFDFVSSLPSDISGNAVKPLSDRNAIVVSGTQQTIEKIEHLVRELDIDNDDIRSQQLTAVSVEVDEDGLITIDAKDALMTAVIREIAIKTGINVAILNVTSEIEEILRPRIRTQTQQQAAQQTGNPPTTSQTPLRSRRAPSRTQPTTFEIGNINLRMEKATLNEVFDALFSGTGYTYALKQSGNKEFYIIGTGELTTGQSNPLTISKRIPLNYLNVATTDNTTSILDLLPLNIPEENIILLPDQNAIAVIGTPEMIEELEKYIAQIDVPTPQVMIEAILLELSLGSAKELGIEWSAEKDRTILDVKSGVSFVFDSLAAVPDAFDANLKALLAENKAKVLSNPRVAVINGQQAKIDVGVTYLFEMTQYIYGGLPDIYVGTENYKSGTESYREGSETSRQYGNSYYGNNNFNEIHTGITLDITPYISASGEITMNIIPKIEDADQISKEQSQVSQRTVETTIRVKDGGMIVIGGLIQNKEITHENKVPVLGDIPLMGRLFSNSKKTQNQSELVIIIKPKLIGQ
jgi:type II secretory pathway component GspD/PulD (secretin)